MKSLNGNSIFTYKSGYKRVKQSIIPMKIKSSIHITIVALSVLLLSCDKNSYQENQGTIFNTVYHIKYSYNRSLQQEIEEELHRFDLSLNPFNKNSVIYKINENKPVEPDSFFTVVFNKAVEVSKNSGGKFDITISPLINAWGFGFKNMDKITPEIIDSLKSFVGYDKIWIDTAGKIRKSDKRVQVNASAIAKGYAVDVIANLLKGYDIENYMVEIGGEIAAKGKNNKGECWHIGIEKPMDDASGMQHQLETVIAICDRAMATSGNYRNYYVKDGKKYAHTIDPQSGYPLQQDILGATVIADDCMTADAYATAFMALGTEKSKELAKKIPNLYYYFIYTKSDGSVDTTYSDGFEQFFTDKLDILSAS